MHKYEQQLAEGRSVVVKQHAPLLAQIGEDFKGAAGVVVMVARIDQKGASIMHHSVGMVPERIWRDLENATKVFREELRNQEGKEHENR